ALWGEGRDLPAPGGRAPRSSVPRVAGRAPLSPGVCACGCVVPSMYPPVFPPTPEWAALLEKEGEPGSLETPKTLSGRMYAPGTVRTPPGRVTSGSPRNRHASGAEGERLS